MEKEKSASKVVLSKTCGWIAITLLVFLDAILDVIFAQGRGLEGNILKPVADLLGISNPIFITPVVLIIFFFAVKGGAWLARVIDKIPVKAEELVLTTLVIAYGVFDLWLVCIYFFNFTFFKNQYYLIPVLIIIALIYSLWAEKKLKN